MGEGRCLAEDRDTSMQSLSYQRVLAPTTLVYVMRDFADGYFNKVARALPTYSI
jgi:hypothetical protein